MSKKLRGHCKRLGLIIAFFGFGCFAPDSVRNNPWLVIGMIILGGLLTIIGGFAEHQFNKAVEGTGPGVSVFEGSGFINFSVSWNCRGQPVPHLYRSAAHTFCEM